MFCIARYDSDVSVIAPLSALYSFATFPVKPVEAGIGCQGIHITKKRSENPQAMMLWLEESQIILELILFQRRNAVLRFSRRGDTNTDDESGWETHERRFLPLYAKGKPKAVNGGFLSFMETKQKRMT